MSFSDIHLKLGESTAKLFLSRKKAQTAYLHFLLLKTVKKILEQLVRETAYQSVKFTVEEFVQRTIIPTSLLPIFFMAQE